MSSAPLRQPLRKTGPLVAPDSLKIMTVQPPSLPVPSPWDILTAARLKVMLGEFGRVVSVSGIGAGDSFTPLTAILGVALATFDESRVLIVDANAQEPRLHEVFQFPKQPGLMDVLDGTSSLELAVQGLTLDNLFLLPFGRRSESLAALLSRPTSVRFFEEIRQAYRYVIIDAGVILNGPEGMLLGAKSDGVVAAVAVGDRRRNEVLKFSRELKQLNIPLFGVVLTTTEG